MKLNWNELADNMKRMEKAKSTKLDVNKTIVIRLDMRSGGSFVKGLNKPFDDSFSEAMEHTAKELAKQVQGAQLVYFGSDEITILLFKNKVKKEFIYSDCIINIVNNNSIKKSFKASKFNKKSFNFISELNRNEINKIIEILEPVVEILELKKSQICS